MGSYNPGSKMVTLILVILASFAESKYSLIEIDEDNPETDYADDNSEYPGLCDNVPRGRPTPIILPIQPGYVKICLGDGPKGWCWCPKLDEIKELATKKEGFHWSEGGPKVKPLNFKNCDNRNANPFKFCFGKKPNSNCACFSKAQFDTDSEGVIIPSIKEE